MAAVLCGPESVVGGAWDNGCGDGDAGNSGGGGGGCGDDGHGDGAVICSADSVSVCDLRPVSGRYEIT